MSWDISLVENKLTDVTVGSVDVLDYEKETLYGKITGKKLSDISNKKAHEVANDLKMDIISFIDSSNFKDYHDEYTSKTYEQTLLLLNSLLLETYKNPEATVYFDDHEISMKETKYTDVELIEVGNYTYNVSEMYLNAMMLTISDFDKLKAENAITTLKMGIDIMESNPDKYKQMNPENGWGNYEGALEYLKTHAIIEVS